MSSISSGANATIDVSATATNLVAANRILGTNVNVTTLSASKLYVDALTLSGVSYSIGSSAIPTTLRARTITIGDSSSIVVIPAETKFLSQTSFVVADNDIHLNQGGVTIVSAGFTILSATSLCQPAFMNIQSQQGWILSCPSGTAKANTFVTPLLQTSVFQVGALSQTSMTVTGNVVFSGISANTARVTATTSLPNTAIPNVTVVAGTSVSALSATTLSVNTMSMLGTLSSATTVTSVFNMISVLSGLSLSANMVVTSTVTGTISFNAINIIHARTLGSMQHSYISGQLNVDNLSATSLSLVVGIMSANVLSVLNEVNVMNLSTPAYQMSATTNVSLSSLVVRTTLQVDSTAALSTVTAVVSGNASCSALSAPTLTVSNNTTATTDVTVGSISAANVLVNAGGVVVQTANRITNLTTTTMSLSGTLATPRLDANTLSAAATLTATSLYATNVTLSSLVVTGTLSVNERVSAYTTVLGSTLEFTTGVATPGLRMEYGTVTTDGNAWGSVTFTRAFANAPTVQVQARTSSTGFAWATMTTAPTSTGVVSLRTFLNHVSMSSMDIDWIAVGI